MLPQVVSYTSWALTGVSKQNTEERLPQDCWDKGRLEVHVLLSLFTDEDIKTFHMCSKGRVRLPFLLPDKACSGNNHSGTWYDACAVEHSFVILRVGSVGDCFFFTDWPHEKGLLVLI